MHHALSLPEALRVGSCSEEQSTKNSFAVVLAEARSIITKKVMATVTLGDAKSVASGEGALVLSLFLTIQIFFN